jgi:general secretion pathway protein D
VQGSIPQVPMIQYQDLGLTLKVTPTVMRSGRVALKMDLQIDGLSGAFIDGNPVLNNRAYSGVITVRQGETVEVASEIDQSQSRALTGTPGIGEIPGLNGVEEHNNQKNYATLLILITPHVIRGTQAAGRTPMLAVAPGGQQATGPAVYPKPATPGPPAPPRPGPARPVPARPLPAEPQQPTFPGMR